MRAQQPSDSDLCPSVPIGSLFIMYYKVLVASLPGACQGQLTNKYSSSKQRMLVVQKYPPESLPSCMLSVSYLVSDAPCHPAGGCFQQVLGFVQSVQLYHRCSNPAHWMQPFQCSSFDSSSIRSFSFLLQSMIFVMISHHNRDPESLSSTGCNMALSVPLILG